VNQSSEPSLNQVNSNFFFDVSLDTKSAILEHLRLLPELKTLKMYLTLDDDEEIEAIEFIGENLTELKHLAIVVSENNVKEAVEMLQSSFPLLGCDSVKYKKVERAWNWLITIREH
jgi:hypothetical protein